ncbi:hypothetical protein ZWY2020_052093 [Hordeum vulgare]|nr:hypothetical protein ZWY2020_052093 [Hordeum vulgare]
MSKFATPPPIGNSDMSSVLYDATSAIHDAYDDVLLDNDMPLGAFLDAQIARVSAECDDTSETDEIIEVEPVVTPVRPSSPRYELHDIPKGDAKTWFTSLAPGCVRNPQDMIYYFFEKYFSAHKKQAALQDIYNFVQVEEESLPQAWGRLVQLLNALPDHPLEKNEILDIFYNGLTDASRDHLDSCVGCVLRERTVEQAEILLNNILSNDNAWTIPEPPLKPTPKKRGILFLSPEDMQEAKKSMQEKGIKSEDVKNLPPIEEIHGLDNPTQGVSTDAPSHPGIRKKKKDDRNLHTSKHVAVTPENPNDVSVSDAEIQSGEEHEPSDNIDSGVHVDAQPSNDKDVEIEPVVDLDNPQLKNKRYDKNDFIARKHGKEREPWVQKPMPFPPKPSKKKDDEDFERFVEMIRPIFL